MLRQGTYDVTEARSGSQVVWTGENGARTPSIGTYGHVRVSPKGDTVASFDFSDGVLGFSRVTDLNNRVFRAPASYQAMPLMAYLPDGRLLAVTTSDINSNKHSLMLFDENFDTQSQDFYTLGTYYSENIDTTGSWSLAAGGQCVLQMSADSFTCWPIPQRALKR
jgi:hypothetical protein